MVVVKNGRLYQLSLHTLLINLVLDQKEIERFYCDETVQAYYPGSKRLQELLGQIIDNNVMWDKTKRVAIIDLDALEKNNTQNN
ncbi:MAG: hypothetical protein BWY15_02148 [Firmicutes bacterium ADurb.Bin193]|nr:MAG: hypothetical protein BWY15_02148 [Firmicutes bacterium ADurb.Bin193]